MLKALQLVKTIYGLSRPSRDASLLACCADDPTLSNMDAPDLLPSGSARRIISLSDGELTYHRESICYREGLFGPFQNY
jgi:hypothetical protein